MAVKSNPYKLVCPKYHFQMDRKDLNKLDTFLSIFK